MMGPPANMLGDKGGGFVLPGVGCTFLWCFFLLCGLAARVGLIGGIQYGRAGQGVHEDQCASVENKKIGKWEDCDGGAWPHGELLLGDARPPLLHACM